MPEVGRRPRRPSFRSGKRMRTPSFRTVALAGGCSLLALSGVRAQSSAAGAGGDLSSSICTDRPTKTSNPCTVEAGRIQYEADVFNGAFQRQGGVTTDTYLATDPTLKYGLTPSIDVEAEIAPYEVVRTRNRDAPAETLGGVGDLYLRLKYGAYGRGDDKLQVALDPFVKAPTARRGVGDGAVEGGLQVPVAYRLSDKLTFGATPEFDANADQARTGRHLYMAQTASLALSLPGAITVYGEVAGDWDFDPGSTTRQYSADVAVSWVAVKALQFDAGLNFGLNAATPGVQAYAGVSQKF